jgi:ribose 5-phosphate isomerase B
MWPRMKIALASDHAALDLKADLAAWLSEQGHDVADLGAQAGESVDYPDYGYKLAEYLAAGLADRGIALCGSGIGIAIAMNRNPAVRCAQASEPLSARFARTHNDANAIALGARLIGPEMARACVAAFLGTDFEGGRHQRRVDKLSNPQVAKESA